MSRRPKGLRQLWPARRYTREDLGRQELMTHILLVVIAILSALVVIVWRM
jgi:hypothetical protein